VSKELEEAGNSIKFIIMKDKKAFIVFITTLLIIIIDQLTKLIISKNISINYSIPVIKNIFHITYIQNMGAGFGLFQGQQFILIWISIIVIGIIFYYYDKLPANKSIYLSIGLILSGTISNLIDRIRLNYVVDFIDFRIWPAFNIADSCITVGAILLIVYLIKK